MSNLIPAILLTFIFFVAGIGKISNFKATALGMKKMTNLKFVPTIFFNLLIFCAILIEIAVPLIIIGNIFNYVNKSITKYAILLLIFFTIIATLIYHFPTNPGQKNPFMKNVAIIGGLIAYNKLLN